MLIDPAERLCRTIGLVITSYPTMTTQHLHVLLAIAASPGITGARLRAVTGLQRNAVHQNTKTLGEMHYNGRDPGFGLIVTRTDPNDARGLVHTLSPAGRAFVDKIFGHL